MFLCLKVVGVPEDGTPHFQKSLNRIVSLTYQLNGSQIVTESWGNHLLIYLYDAEGSPIGMQYRNTSYGRSTFQTFWFEKNLQGDIVAVYNAAGTKLISYTYEAWGKFSIAYHNGCTPTSVASYNPFRYRGYYYDTDTGLYYLQSRYYDPIIGRFLNADIYISTGQGLLGYNMFSYCLNNPIIGTDPSGTYREVKKLFCYDMINADNGAGAIIIGTAILIPLLLQLAEECSETINLACKEVYEYSRVLRKALANAKESMPHVHHIVPIGNFSTRSATTSEQIRVMHDMLMRAGINFYMDPVNLMLVSAKSHASLHTDAYIAYVYSYIMATDGSKEQIYMALLLLRIEIAAKDAYANGY